jgi:hypothetical protein
MASISANVFKSVLSGSSRSSGNCGTLGTLADGGAGSRLLSIGGPLALCSTPPFSFLGNMFVGTLLANIQKKHVDIKKIRNVKYAARCRGWNERKG